MRSNKLAINDEIIANIYNLIAKSYEHHRIHEPSPCDLIDFPLVKKINFDLKDKRILDAGCGTGIFIKELVESFELKEAMGIDISEKMLDIAKKRLRGIPYVVLKKASLLDTGLKSNYYDKIFSIVVLDYIEDISKALLEFKRILKKDGEIYITVRHSIRNLSYLTMNGNGNYFEKGWHKEKWPGTDGISIYHYYRPISDWINSIIDSGLKISRMIETKPDDSIKLNYPDFYDKYIRLPRGILFVIKK